MSKVKAVLFDLDDTLLDRNAAVDALFLLVLERCYGDVDDNVKSDMLRAFKLYDKKSFGQGDKTPVLESFFADFPTGKRLPTHAIQDFWNEHFPTCFSIKEELFNLLHTMKQQVKIGIVTNGTSLRQNEKITNTHLDRHFDTIIISEEVGSSKPDKTIFEIALAKLGVQPEEVLFVGDHLILDIYGSQSLDMMGIWYNPGKIENHSDIQPYGEIESLDQLLFYLT
ncbi:HAD family hydrolase [Bacillus sp. KH172YL63]|uniref:HAD family hydrolase n=1 Tax=Bacillus sp. KH172YL63 TaxID=2709784 RepID=UPI0013E42EBF|nr:HAD-IA family hydrolase [Bacillus sp. KH172YL63]BCB04043.1 2-haloalkanoic acid dehalogenase [Bacillus sp. KH172YL63]